MVLGGPDRSDAVGGEVEHGQAFAVQQKTKLEGQGKCADSRREARRMRRLAPGYDP